MTNWDESEHPRHPAGTKLGGQFRHSLGGMETVALSAGNGLKWAERISQQVSERRYFPGYWTRYSDPASLKTERWLEVARMMEEDGLPAMAAKAQAADMFAEIDPPRAVYRNGPHTVSVETNNPDLPIEHVLDWVDELHARNPARGPIRISIVPADFEATGQTHPPAASILLNEKAFTLWNTNDAQGMPIAYTTPKWQYVLTHEWGHAIDPFFTDELDYESREAYLDAWTQGKGEENGDMSPYGRQNAAESFAEAFAEWYLTDGATPNNAANDYAALFGWKGRYGRFV